LAGRRHKRHAMTFGRQAQTTAVEARRVESGTSDGAGEWIDMALAARPRW
jgi:hypothetical protein